MSARRILISGISLTLVFFATAVPSSSLEKVRLGYSGIGSGEEVHHFAKEVGLFKKAGLDVEIV
jgi:ABC-type nitrate/sulfonate/bicarbonate transport system substrate-binding protein